MSPLRSLVVVLLFGLTLTGCSRYSTPIMERKADEKAVVGMVDLTDGPGSKAPFAYISHMRLDIAPVTSIRKVDGKYAISKQSPEVFRLRMFGEKAPLGIKMSFFIPLRPGVYQIEGIDYGIGQQEYKYKNGIEGPIFKVSDKYDATFIGTVGFKNIRLDESNPNKLRPKIIVSFAVNGGDESLREYKVAHPTESIATDLMAIDPQGMERILGE